MFEIAEQLDAGALAEIYRSHGRVQIVGFLSEASAKRFYDDLAASVEWKLTANNREQIIDFDLEQVSSWPPEQHRHLEDAVTHGGRYGFQFRYEVIRVKEGAGSCVAEFQKFMSSPAVVDLMRAITGADDIAFADAHATRYKAGHFLTTHDDEVESMGRRAAYVLNLTPVWRPDWGGLLQFFDAQANVTRAFTPGFNMLNLFAVPQAHNVSWVTPLAGAARYAVTGWLRAK